jgi:hypothetical protein
LSVSSTPDKANLNPQSPIQNSAWRDLEMTETRKFTAIALGISALSMSFMAVVLPGVASADVPWDGPKPTAEPATGSDACDVPWDQPCQ